MTISLGTGLLVAVLVARLLLPRAARALAKHASTELYQLTIVSFCLCSGWVSGYMVRPLETLQCTRTSMLPVSTTQLLCLTFSAKLPQRGSHPVPETFQRPEQAC